MQRSEVSFLMKVSMPVIYLVVGATQTNLYKVDIQVSLQVII